MTHLALSLFVFCQALSFLVAYSLDNVDRSYKDALNDCKDTMSETECQNMDKNWGMCKQGGYNADQCKKTCKKCTPSGGGGGGGDKPKPESRRRRSGGGGQCKCEKSTSWDGSFPQYASGEKDFCNQGWGGANPYVCAGGGSAGAAIPCTSSQCSSGQFTFTEEEGWKIKITKGGMPYRAFAFVKYCNGKSIKECWGGAADFTFSFSFKTEDMTNVASFVKLFFWTDNGNMLGFIPPKHAKSGGQYKLATFMQDDYPNKWQDDTVIEDGKWYHITITFTPASKGVKIKLDGKDFSEGTIPVQMLNDQNGPQLGAYIFGDVPPFNLWINDICVGKASGVCPSGSLPGPAPTPAPTPPDRRRRRKTPAPTPPDEGQPRRRSSSRRRRRTTRRRSPKRRRGSKSRRRSSRRRKSRRRR